MPVFSSEPPPSDRPKNLKLVRTPIKGNLTAMVLSDEILGCNTHFWGGRTVPCEAPNCPACDDGSPTRWHGYLAIWLPNDNIKLLYEFTEGVADTLLQYRKANGTLRGCRIVASRARAVPNGRVLLKTSSVDLSKYPVPPAPDVAKLLLHMWDLPGKAFKADRKVEGHPQLDATPEVLDKMRRTGSTRVEHAPPNPANDPQPVTESLAAAAAAAIKKAKRKGATK